MNFADQEEISERRKRRGKKRRNDVLWNSLTVIFVIASVGAIGFFLVLFANPAASINPYPPPTMPVLIKIPAATPTHVTLPPTWTPTPTKTATALLIVSATTPAVVDQTPAATSTSIPAGDYLFAAKGNPVGTTNTTFHPSLDCNWQGVAGTVKDIQGKPIDGLTIHVTGTYNGQPVDTKTISGGADQWIGPSGYEVVFEKGSMPIASTGLLTIQLEDSSGLFLSGKVTFDTFGDCSKNLILINFQQVQ